MSNTVIEFNNVGKQYILGSIGTGTLSQSGLHWYRHTESGPQSLVGQYPR